MIELHPGIPFGKACLFKKHRIPRLETCMASLIITHLCMFLMNKPTFRSGSWQNRNSEGNRLVRKKAPAADGSLAITLYIYDASGNLTKQIDPIFTPTRVSLDITSIISGSLILYLWYNIIKRIVLLMISWRYFDENKTKQKYRKYC